MGCFGNLFPAFLFTKAETGISSALAGMLNALTPLFAIVVGILLFRMKIKLNQIIGVLVGFGGALMLVFFDHAEGEKNNIVFALMVALATLFYAISVNSIKKFLSDLNSITATVWSFTFIGLITILSPFIYSLLSKGTLNNNLWYNFFYILKTNPEAWTSLGY